MSKKIHCRHIIDHYNGIMVQFKSLVPVRFDFEVWHAAETSSISVCNQAWSGRFSVTSSKCIVPQFGSFLWLQLLHKVLSMQNFVMQSYPGIVHQQRTLARQSCTHYKNIHQMRSTLTSKILRVRPSTQSNLQYRKHIPWQKLRRHL